MQLGPAGPEDRQVAAARPFTLPRSLDPAGVSERPGFSQVVGADRGGCSHLHHLHRERGGARKGCGHREGEAWGGACREGWGQRGVGPGTECSEQPHPQALTLAHGSTVAGP